MDNSYLKTNLNKNELKTSNVVESDKNCSCPQLEEMSQLKWEFDRFKAKSPNLLGLSRQF